MKVYAGVYLTQKVFSTASVRFLSLGLKMPVFFFFATAGFRKIKGHSLRTKNFQKYVLVSQIPI